MIDYFVLPAFFADNTSQAMAMIAAAVNGDSKDALAQTPHHFELWQLGEIQEQTGNLTEHKEFVAECAGFIRNRVRESPNGRAGEDRDADREAGSPPRRNESRTQRPNGPTEGAEAGKAQKS